MSETDVLNAGTRASSSLSSAVESERTTLRRTSYTEKNEARLFALRVVRDPIYQESVLSRAKKGDLPPAVEIRLMEYAWGKPTERVEIGAPGTFEDLSELPMGALLERAKSLTLRVAALEIEETSSFDEEKRLLAQTLLEEETDLARAAAKDERS